MLYVYSRILGYDNNIQKCNCDKINYFLNYLYKKKQKKNR